MASRPRIVQIYMITQMCPETQRPKDPHKKKGMCLGRDIPRIYYIYIYIINSYYLHIYLIMLYFVETTVQHSVRSVEGLRYAPLQ